LKPDLEIRDTHQEHNTSCTKQVRKPVSKNNEKLDEIRKRYIRKIAAQPEGYREKLLANLRDKYKIHPKLQEELAAEWGLKDASDT